HGQEPPALAQCRRRYLAVLEGAWQDIDADDAAAVAEFRRRHDAYFERDYRKASRDALYRQWQHLCAYCGAERNASDPVDHFRPRRPQPNEHEGYWWLTWSWHNLLPSCTTCNSPRTKG